MRGTIVGLQGMLKGRTAPLRPGIITIGRHSDNSLPFHDDSTVSREHCILAFQNGAWLCWDVGSTNGTFVNGVRIGPSPTPVPNGAEISFGAQTLRVDYAKPALNGLIDAINRLAAKPVTVAPPPVVSQSRTAERPSTPTPPTIPKGSQATWYGLDREVHVHGFILVSPFCFVGTKLALQPKRQSQYITQQYPDEPGLINPSLKIRPSIPDPLPYYPNYQQASPEQRWTFLNWLSGNRESDVEQGYLFLFFYGLERYLTQGSPSPREALAILQELMRLALQHADCSSFRHYVFRLHAAHWTFYPQLINEKSLRLFKTLADDEFIWMLACLASHQMQLTSTIVMCWFDLNAYRLVKRSLWQRCHPELTQLFAIRYISQFGDRRVLHCSGEKAHRTYYPANFSVRDAIKPFFAYQALDDSAILNSMKDMLASCATDLQLYAKAKAIGLQTLRSFANLPRELFSRDRQIAALASYLSVHDNGGVFILEWLDVLRELSIAADMNKVNLTDLAITLDKLGYHMEPNPAYGSKPLKSCSSLAVCKAVQATGMGEDQVASIMTVARIAAWVLCLDSPTPETVRQLPGLIAKSLSADPGCEERLDLALRLFELAPSKPTASELQTISPELRPHVIPILIRAVKHIGTSKRATLGELERIAAQFGLPTSELLTQMYQEQDPIPIVSAGTSANGFAIPPPPKEKATQVNIDETKLRQRQEESESARAFLEDIFREAEPAEQVCMKNSETPTARYAKILEALPEGKLTNTQFEKICRDFGFLPGQIRTELNETALELCGYALIEGDEILGIDLECLKQLRDEYNHQT
ncbi:MAG TPA: TerB N-terminal domain-containing protein [Fimbriimonadaceae bacterium]|jgi:hypothetical protein